MLSPRSITLMAAGYLISGAAASCDATEGTELFCYTDSDSVPQNVDVADIQFVASYLRSYGQQTRDGRQFVMLAADTPNCEEYTLYQRGSVLALGKHLDPSVNSSVLFTDIANTIDGGTGTAKTQAIIDCAEAGGSFGVVYNATNAQYNTTAYLSKGYTPEGILVKIVSSA
ncbi:hypothetical protein E8E14_002230 [Neopestalotiopsis sp. 37M]|nr:hypothetical protein E8E14_002230 [Neopestalotiopsis sp. 37M]